MEKFVKNHRKSANKDKKSEFFVTYLIIGQDLSTNSTRVFLKNENELGQAEKECKIVSKQIYSIENKQIEV